ncbi:Centromere/kinetochore protein zw10 [Podochytrium sp. JEL0797]|nr:Centromere/kinetochore protein zw10 [Podochytrium sp. JEL0797]
MLASQPSIADLQEAVGKLEGTVMSSISSIYLDYGAFGGSSADFREDVLQVQGMFALVKKASSRGAEVLYPEQRMYFDAKIELLSLLEKIHRELTGFEMMLETKELSGAATAISDAKALMEELGDLQTSYGCPPELYKALKSTVLAKKGNLKHKFDELIRTAFFFSRENDISELNITFRIIVTSSSKYHESPVFLMTLIKSMNSAGLLTEYLTTFMESFVKLFVQKMIENPAQELSTTKTKLSASIKFGTAKSISSTQASQRVDVKTVFQKVFESVKFMRDCLLGPVTSGEWTPESECFVHIMAPLIIDTMLREAMCPSIPDNREDMNKYGEYLEAVRAFDRNMKEESLLFPDTSELLEFVATANMQYARNRKSRLLINIRKIIESEDQNTYEVDDATERGSIRSLHSAKNGGGKVAMDSAAASGKAANLEKHGLEINDTSFRLPRCHVSVQAQTLVEQAYQTLEEAVGLDRESALELFYCTRDIFDLYRAVTPILHADEILNSPARAVIFYNDCEYFAHHLLTMGYQYQDRLPEPANQFATFLDMIPFFRNLGERYFRSQLRKQRDVLKTLVANAGGFSNLTNDAKFETVEKCIKQALSHLNMLNRVWKPLLSVDVYLNTMGLLVDSFLEAVMAQTADLSQLSKDEGHQLRYVLGLIHKVENCFEKKGEAGKVGEKVSMRKFVSKWDTFVAVFDKLCA